MSTGSVPSTIGNGIGKLSTTLGIVYLRLSIWESMDWSLIPNLCANSQSDYVRLHEYANQSMSRQTEYNPAFLR